MQSIGAGGLALCIATQIKKTLIKLEYPMKLFTHLFAFILGIVFAAVMVKVLMPSLMITEQVSPLPLEETINRITANAEAEGWVVSGVTAIDKSVKKHGGFDILPVRLINFCEPEYASTILKDPRARKVSLFMPCTVSVYEGEDGQTYVANMNAGLLGKMFGGTVEEVMGVSVAADQKAFLEFINAK